MYLNIFFMGHLINARSTRLGWFQHWWDVWFSRNSHYAELTMSCLRIRYFMIYLFFSRVMMIKHLLLFSHFQMIKLYKLFIVKIFYYDAALEESIDDCLDFFKRQQYIAKRRSSFIRRNISQSKLKFNNNLTLANKSNSIDLLEQSQETIETNNNYSIVDLIKILYIVKSISNTFTYKNFAKFIRNHSRSKRNLINKDYRNKMKILMKISPFFYKFMTRQDKFLYYFNQLSFEYKKSIINKSLGYLQNYLINKSYLNGYIYKLNQFNCPQIRVELFKMRDVLNSNILNTSAIKRLKNKIIKFVKLFVPQIYTYYEQLNKYKIDFNNSYLNNSYDTSYKTYITAIKKLFFNSDMLYLRQQNKVKLNLINIRNCVYSKNFKYLLRSYKKVIYIKKSYYSLLNKLRISKDFINLKNLTSKLVSKFDKINYIFNRNINFINASKLDITFWSLLRRCTRIRYDMFSKISYKYKWDKTLNELYFYIDNKYYHLFRKSQYHNQISLWKNRINNLYNLPTKRKFFIYDMYRKIRNYYKISKLFLTNWENPNMSFYSIIKLAKFPKMNLLKLKDMYINILSNLKHVNKFNTFIFKHNFKRRLYIISRYWAKLVRQNLVKYNFYKKFNKSKKLSHEKKLYFDILKKHRSFKNKKNKSVLDISSPWRNMIKAFWYKPHMTSQSSKISGEKSIFSKSLGSKFKRRLQSINNKGKFLSLLLHNIGNLPFEILVKKKKTAYISKYESYIKNKLEYIKKADDEFEKQRMSKFLWRREKMKKKLLADPNNKYTEKELDLYLFNSVSIKSPDNVIEPKKSIFEDDLESKYLANLKKNINILKNINLNKIKYIYNSDKKVSIIDSKIINLCQIFCKIYNKDLKSVDSLNWWKKFRSISNFKILINYINICAIKFKNSFNLKKSSYKSQYLTLLKKNINNWNDLRNGHNNDSYYKKFKSISLPSSIAYKITKALLKADGFRLRRFLSIVIW